MLREVIRSVRKKYPTLDIVALIDKDNRKSLCLFEKAGFSAGVLRGFDCLFCLCALCIGKVRGENTAGFFLFRKLCYTEKNAAGEYYVN